MFLAKICFFFRSGLAFIFPLSLSLYPHKGKASSLPRVLLLFEVYTRAQIIRARRRHTHTHTHLSRVFISRVFIIHAHTREQAFSISITSLLLGKREKNRERRNTRFHTCLLRRVNVSSGTLNDFNRIHRLGFPAHRRVEHHAVERGHVWSGRHALGRRDV